jgi:fibronectin-binding autotransporter adhesin
VAAMVGVCFFGSGIRESRAVTWDGNGSLANGTYSWNDDLNWDAAFPNANGAVANLGVDFTGTVIINLNTSIIVGSLTLGDSSGTSIVSIAPNSGCLTFNNNGSTATLVSQGGANTISSGISLQDNTQITTNSALTLSGVISGCRSLTKLGTGGNLILSNTGNSFSGGLIVEAGIVSFANENVAAAGNSALGSGTVTLDGGTIRMDNNTERTISRAITVNSGGGTIRGKSRVIINGAITGDGALTLFAESTSDTNRMVVKSDHSYAGGTTIGNGGIVELFNGANDRLPTTTAITLTSGATLRLGTSNGAVNQEVAGLTAASSTSKVTGNHASTHSVLTVNIASGTNEYIGALGSAAGNDNNLALVKKGSGTLVVSGSNTYVGTTTVEVGTLLATKAGALPGYNAASRVTVASGATLAVRAGGGSEWTSSEIDSLLGATTAAFSSGSVFGIDVSGSNTFTYASDIGATQAAKGFVKSGTGCLTLSAANTYTGLTTVSGGTLEYGIADAISTGCVTVTGSGAILDLKTYNDTVGTVTLDGGGQIKSTSGILTSTGTFEMKSGTVSAILGGSSIALNKTTAGTVTLSGVNTYTGLTTVSAGALEYGVNDAISTGCITINGSTAIFDLKNYTDTVGTVTLDGGGQIKATGAGVGEGILTSTDTFQMKSGTVSAKLAGSVGLSKTTSGTATLSGANSYSGATSVSEGTLEATVDGALGSTSAVNINGGTLLLKKSGGGSSTIVNDSAAFTLNGGILKLEDDITEQVGTLTLSSSSTIDLNALGTIKFAASSLASWTNGAVLSIHNWVLDSATVYFGNSASGLGGGQPAAGQILLYSGAGTGLLGTAELDSNGQLITPIPEPGTVAVVVLLGLFLAWRERRMLGVLVFRTRTAG